MFFYVLKNEKNRKQRIKREGYGKNKEVENIEKNVFVIFVYIPRSMVWNEEEAQKFYLFGDLKPTNVVIDFES